MQMPLRICITTTGGLYILAESEGFEPPVPRRVQQISSLPRSTTPAALHIGHKFALYPFILFLFFLGSFLITFSIKRLATSLKRWSGISLSDATKFHRNVLKSVLVIPLYFFLSIERDISSEQKTPTVACNNSPPA